MGSSDSTISLCNQHLFVFGMGPTPNHFRKELSSIALLWPSVKIEEIHTGFGIQV